MSLWLTKRQIILHPPLSPLPSREGKQKGNLLLLPSSLVGKGEGEGIPRHMLCPAYIQNH